MKLWMAVGWMLGAALSLPAIATDIAPQNAWHACQSDAECVLIEGVCQQVAVNAAYQKEATAYYHQEQAKAKCAQNFWAGKSSTARCKLESCSKITD